MDPTTMPTDDQLLMRAVTGAQSMREAECQRWVAVRDLFSVGSTTARSLCTRFGMDPDEIVGRPQH